MNSDIIIDNNEKIKSPLNICLVGVFGNGYSSSIFFSKSLQKLDVISSVTEFDYRDTLKRNYYRIIEIITNLAKSHDVLIIFKGNNIPIHAIKMASKYCYIYLWFMDWYPNLKAHKNLLELSRYCHYRSATGFETALLWSDNIQLPTYHILDGVDPETFYPTYENKKYDVTFIGGNDTERTTIYNFLKNSGFSVRFFGPKFTQFIYPEEFRQICSQSKIVLNISRGSYTGYSSLRLWSLLGCGSMVLTKKIPDMEKYMGLIPDTHVVEFENLIDLKLKIHRYLSNEKDREQIAQSGMKFALNNRTWIHSTKEVMQVILTEPTAKVSNDVFPGIKEIKKIKDSNEINKDKIIKTKNAPNKIKKSGPKWINQKEKNKNGI